MVWERKTNVLGCVRGDVIYNIKLITHEFLILPDQEAVLPLLIESDLISKYKISFCEIKVKYNKTEILKLNLKN